ncbi:MAG: prepilin-type N-terminal cleavage/methylation domain-containing protein [Phycisphaeraceae bacterium]|nr:prepilin-type N-terminal cleavage/methylation domain-containing protein [Phycisphaeraceae bacterium]
MCRSTTTRTAKGYTLIEVLITVTIMGIAAAIIVPSMLRGGSLGVQAGARMIIADLLFAQNEAMAQQSTRRVVFDANDNSYRVEKYDSGATAWVLEFNPSKGMSRNQQNYEMDFDEDRRFSGIEIVSADFNGSSTVEFDDLGNPSSGGSIEIRFEGHEYQIKVAPFTGRVTVERVTS